MRSTTKDKSDARIRADALATLDAAIGAVGLGAVSDLLVTHPSTVDRYHKRTRNITDFMAKQVLRVLAAHRLVKR